MAEAFSFGNVFWVSDETNLTRNRIRDAAAKAALCSAIRFGFQAEYQAPGDASAVSIWVIPDENNKGLNMMRGETGTTSMTLHAPRQTDFPPTGGFLPGARLIVADQNFACNVSHQFETPDQAPIFRLDIERLDISAEIDGTDI